MSKSTTKYSNNARTTLSADITSGSTTLPVNTVAGFPSISAAGDHFHITLDDGVNIEIVKVMGISGSSFINCVRGQESTVAVAFSSGAPVENRLTAGNITALARIQDRLASLASINDLESPADTDGNSALCATVDAFNNPIVALVNGTKWKLTNYPDTIRTGVVGASSTTTSISIPSISSVLIDTTDRVYVIQFTSGVNIGRCRIITSVATNTLNFSSALPAALSPSDTYEIYRCISTWKAPLGGNSDRIFFENDNKIWFDYSIPVNRNASSTGPIDISPGVTVTVPAGSAWSIL